MDYPEAAHKAGLEMVISLIYWARPFDSVRKTERFKNFVRDAGMLEYWKAKGWPDFCHPVGADDFACN